MLVDQDGGLSMNDPFLSAIEYTVSPLIVVGLFRSDQKSNSLIFEDLCFSNTSLGTDFHYFVATIGILKF